MSDSVPTTPAPKRPTDWEAIERDYRAGLLSLREIANHHGITEGAIRKRAKRDMWARDLAAKIKAKAEELVRKESVVRVPGTQLTPATEIEVVEGNARQVASVQINQRRDIHSTRNTVMTMLAEMNASSGVDNVALLENLGEIMREPSDAGQDKRNDLYMAVISLPERSKTIKNLVESFAKLVALEREAFGLGVDVKPPAGDLEMLLGALGQRSAFPVTKV